jgi:serine/threonine protein kinase
VGKLFVGRYMLSRKIGGGGMSTIYEARDVTLGVRVVVKIMRGDLPSDPVDRFRREALVLAGCPTSTSAASSIARIRRTARASSSRSTSTASI